MLTITKLAEEVGKDAASAADKLPPQAGEEEDEDEEDIPPVTFSQLYRFASTSVSQRKRRGWRGRRGRGGERTP